MDKIEDWKFEKYQDLAFAVKKMITATWTEIPAIQTVLTE